MKTKSALQLRVTDDRIYCDLGDGPVNFSDVEHMKQVRNTYRRVIKRGSLMGSATFTAGTMVQMRRRLENITAAIDHVRMEQGNVKAGTP